MKRAIFMLIMGFAASIIWLASKGDVEVGPGEIARRCAAGKPTWESYQEDIKGQIGAGPVAAWSGHPVSVVLEAGEVTVDFTLEAPWAGYDAALPILLRDSFGTTCRHHTAERVDGLRRYHFQLRGEALQRMPGWIELRYPHDEAWIPLDTEGRWRKSNP